MSAGLLAAYAASFVLGAALWLVIAGLPRRDGDRLAATGYSALLGLLVSGVLVGTRRDVSGAQLFAATLPLIGIVVVLCAGVAVWRIRRTTAPAPTAATPVAKLPYWAWFLLAAIAVRFAFVLDEAFLRPVFVWDAWNAWSLKAKTWFELGQVPFVDPQHWWSSADSGAHTALAWRYPELLSRVELWLAAGAGAWNEGAIATAWPLLWLALIAGCAGQWRALGVSRVGCVILAYMLASLPLLSVHAGLAGYADLWVATALTFAVLGIVRWLRDGDRAQFALAVCCLAALPLLKFEGTIWALVIVGLTALMQMPPRWRRIGLAVAVLAAIALIGLSWSLRLPWLALVQEMLNNASAGDVTTSRLTAAAAFLKGLFAQNNWHLLWPLLIVCIVLCRDVLRERRELALIALLLAGAFTALLGLFVFTPAAKWAATETAANRLVLHWVPLALSLVGLLLSDAKWLARKPDASLQ
jgi:hypothetical protein